MLEKRRLRARGGLRRLFLYASLFLFVGGATYLVWLSPFFDIQEIVLQGESLAEEVNFESALGKNILFWQPDFNLDDAPQIASLTVKKDYLGKRVEITLEPRERYILWCAELQSECFWVDIEGVAFSGAPNVTGRGILRLVRDLYSRDIALGKPVLEDEFFKGLREAFDFLERVGASLDEIRIENIRFREAVAHLSEGPRIYFSLQENPSFGESVVRSLKEEGQWHSVDYIDLRIPGRVYHSD